MEGLIVCKIVKMEACWNIKGIVAVNALIHYFSKMGTRSTDSQIAVKG